MKKTPRDIPVLFIKPRKKPEPVPPIAPRLKSMVRALDSAGLKVVPK